MATFEEAFCFELDCCPEGFGVPDITVSEAIEVEEGNCTSNCSTVTGVDVTNSGSGYSSTPTVTIALPTLIGGVQATANAVMNPTGDKVLYIVITNPGSGYEFVPSVTIANGNPTTPATAVATIYLSGDSLINIQTESYVRILS